MAIDVGAFAVVFEMNVENLIPFGFTADGGSDGDCVDAITNGAPLPIVGLLTVPLY